MTEAERLRKLDELRALPHETEWVEFKEAKNSYGFDKLGRYFSALANEANLASQPCGWLIFGVANKDHGVCGSRYRINPADLDCLKHEIAKHAMGVTFRDIHVVRHPEGRVVMFEVPAAPDGMPVSFKGHWYGRDGESLVALNLYKLEDIRSKRRLHDWSAEICPSATIDDLDPAAVETARRIFHKKSRNRSFAGDMDSWSTAEFLDRARLTKGGKVTRACLLLLGREETVFHLEPAVAQLTWKLTGDETIYEHFGPPFLLTTNELYSRIRNPIQHIDIPEQLIPLEIPKYEKWVILEALHNAIAHQDYSLQSRIIVTEHPDSLTFGSNGSFFEGILDDYTTGDKTPQRYRNRFLADAMVTVNMIDTMGYGIRRMYQAQRDRFYPLPDYDLSNAEKVVVTVCGKVIDPNYTLLLMKQRDLHLRTVIMLDRIQKQQPISKEAATVLRRQGLAEGRYPNVYVAAHVASATGDKAQYIKNRAFDDEHYRKLILKYLKQYGQATRKEIDDLISDKLSDVLNREQKRNKVTNLIQSLAAKSLIRNEGSRKYPKWKPVL